MDTLKAMRMFVRLVELKSLARAAADVSIEKGTASKLLAQLEDHLGVRLVERHARRLQITGEGQDYYADAKQILLDVDRVEARARGDTMQAKGKLLVEMPSALAQGVMCSLLPEFLAEHPELQIELMVSDQALDVVEMGIDVAIRTNEPNELDRAARKLGSARRILCASPRYRHPPDAHGRMQVGLPVLADPAELEQHRCLISYHPTQGWQRRWDLVEEKSGERRSLDISGPLAVSNLPMLVDMAVAGVGIAQVADVCVARELAEGRLVRVLPDWVGSSVPVFAVFAPIRPLPQRISTFLDFLSDRLSLWSRQSGGVPARVVDSVDALRPDTA